MTFSSNGCFFEELHYSLILKFGLYRTCCVIYISTKKKRYVFGDKRYQVILRPGC